MKLLRIMSLLFLVVIVSCQAPISEPTSNVDGDLDQQFRKTLESLSSRSISVDNEQEGTLWRVTNSGVTQLTYTQAVIAAKEYKWIDTNGSFNNLQDAINGAMSKVRSAGKPLVLVYVAQSYDYWNAEDSKYKEVYSQLIADVAPEVDKLSVSSHSWSGHLVARIVWPYSNITHTTLNPAHGNLKSGEKIEDYIYDIDRVKGDLVILTGYDDNITTQGGGSAYKSHWWGIAGYNSVYYAIQRNSNVSLEIINDAGHTVNDMLEHGAQFY
ncbi:MAG: hypothetical protein B6229_00925 [Spirochaetaceae bacterium 4572_7]|nr:MAG: hypothetical protein B6229_00925 [Spirochaetaceae bacterium 4572_7]